MMAEMWGKDIKGSNKELVCSIIGGKKEHSDSLYYLLLALGSLMHSEQKIDVTLKIRPKKKKQGDD